MKKNPTPLMVIALAGIAAPLAEAASYVESPDFSNNAATPTVLGAFQPLSDSIQGTLTEVSDQMDLFSVTGPASTLIFIPFSFIKTGGNAPLSVSIYDGPNFSGFLTSNAFLTIGGTSTISFTIPSDGQYVVSIFGNTEGAGGSYTYTLGTVTPEPSASLLLGAVAGVGALRRQRKGTAPER